MEVILTNNRVDFNLTFFRVSSSCAAGMKEDTTMNKYKYLSFEERFIIKNLLDNSASFKEIDRALDRDCTTISKEVRNHLLFQKTGFFGCPFNDCASHRNCPVLLYPGLTMSAMAAPEEKMYLRKTHLLQQPG